MTGWFKRIVRHTFNVLRFWCLFFLCAWRRPSTTRRPFLSTACVRHRYLAPAVVFKMSLWKSFAKMYKANVSRTLRGYGLRLEDIYNEAHPEYYQVCWEFH